MSLHAAAAPAVDAHGRPARFRAVFEREFDYVWTSLRRLGVQARDAEDVAQDVFVHVYRRLDDYDPARPLRPWLFAFAFRCASDWRRLARHRVEVGDDPDRRAGSSLAADDAIARTEDRALVLRALERVELERRGVFILYELDECPMKEIAETLGIPLFTAYSRLRVARQEFTAAVRVLRAERGER
ncbi:MAG TPA: sigma-70 family RNA polymerase sigma factor [Polyangiaceae bacterium]|jgi:RNA polymerase sigma-70 factor (ECF subfamily)